MSLRHGKELLAKRGIDALYETVDMLRSAGFIRYFEGANA
jgi:hypothetical protein